MTKLTIVFGKKFASMVTNERLAKGTNGLLKEMKNTRKTILRK